MTEIIDVIKVRATDNYCLDIEFSDGLKKTVNFLPFIKEGVSKQLLNKEIFESAKIDYGTVVWENGYDICPLFLRQIEQ